MTQQTTIKIRQVTIIGAVINVILSIIKLSAGLLGNSHALIIDAVHSLSDLVTDILVIAASAIAARKPDRLHPYGYQRYETLTVIIFGALLIGVAGAIVFESITRALSTESQSAPSWIILPGAFVPIIIKEALYQYTIRAAEQLRSPLLKANAWHHRSDTLSSIVVLVGAVFALLGYRWVDPVAAAIVAVMIAHIGLKLIWQSIKEIIEISPIPDQIKTIESMVLGVNGVYGVHNLRCRRMGNKVFLDLHIQVNPTLTVSEGHQIGDWVSNSLIGSFDEIGDVTVHIDPEMDSPSEEDNRENLLPLRDNILELLEKHFETSSQYKCIHHINLHYLADKIDIELFFSSNCSSYSCEEISKAENDLKNYCRQFSWFGSLSVWHNRN